MIITLKNSKFGELKALGQKVKLTKNYYLV
jgi:hypothetical protein